MSQIPEGTTHIRKNLKKGTTVHFKEISPGQYEVSNKGHWERYKDHIRGIVPLIPSRDSKEKPPIHIADIRIGTQTYHPQVSTFKERVFESIPEPVLRQLVHFYENHDVVEVELNVKMTSVIKG